MGETSREYRTQPQVRLAKVYRFPTLSKWEQEELTHDQIRAREEERALQALRAKARLELNQPKPWYKRLAKWYDRNWEDMFNASWAGFAFIFGIMLFLVIARGIGITTGWWEI